MNNIRHQIIITVLEDGQTSVFVSLNNVDQQCMDLIGGIRGVMQQVYPEPEGKCYIQVTNFVKHQKPHANEAESLIPSAVEGLAPLVEALPPMVEALGSERGKRKDERGMLKDECAASPLHAGNEQSEDLGYPIQILVDAFPNMVVTPAAIGFFTNEVLLADEQAWRATVQIYRMNHDPFTKSYLPEKTANVLSVFRSEKAKLAKENGNGKPRAAWQEVGRNSVPDDPNFVFDPASLICDVCGKECCLDLHRANEGVNAI